MKKGIYLKLSGPSLAETAEALAARLTEMGHGVEVIDQARFDALGGPESAIAAGQGFVQDGKIVLLTESTLSPDGDVADFEIEPHDTPDFAAEKALDVLAEAGVVSLDDEDYSPGEEEQIKERLADLGYIE